MYVGSDCACAGRDHADIGREYHACVWRECVYRERVSMFRERSCVCRVRV